MTPRQMQLKQLQRHAPDLHRRAITGQLSAGQAMVKLLEARSDPWAKIVAFIESDGPSRIAPGKRQIVAWAGDNALSLGRDRRDCLRLYVVAGPNLGRSAHVGYYGLDTNYIAGRQGKWFVSDAGRQNYENLIR